MLRLEDWTLFEGDLLPPLQTTVKDGDGNPFDLTGCTAVFVMNTSDGEALVRSAATISDPANGVLYYQWQSGDTDARTGSDPNRAYFEITDGSRKFTVPSADYIYITILARLV